MKSTLLLVIASMAYALDIAGVMPESGMAPQITLTREKADDALKFFWHRIHPGPGDTLTSDELNDWNQRVLNGDHTRTMALLSAYPSVLEEYDLDRDGFISSTEESIFKRTAIFKRENRGNDIILRRFLDQGLMTESRQEDYRSKVADGSIGRLKEVTHLLGDKWDAIDLDKDGWVSVSEYRLLTQTKTVKDAVLPDAFMLFAPEGYVHDQAYALWVKHRLHVAGTLIAMRHEIFTVERFKAWDLDGDGWLDQHEQKRFQASIEAISLESKKPGLTIYYDENVDGAIDDVEMVNIRRDMASFQGFFKSTGKPPFQVIVKPIQQEYLDTLISSIDEEDDEEENKSLTMPEEQDPVAPASSPRTEDSSPGK